jgi:hypothetical protein
MRQLTQFIGSNSESFSQPKPEHSHALKRAKHHQRKSKRCLLALAFVCEALLFAPTRVVAEDTDKPLTKAFYPTWKLLNKAEKQHFVSGYKFASDDMARVLEIVSKFIKDNPEQAEEGIQSLRRVFDYSKISPERLALELDAFFIRSENQEASLSKAISAAKQQM